MFTDLEKADNRVPRKELWYCMRKLRVAEKYVRVVRDMYEDTVTAVWSAVGMADWFEVDPDCIKDQLLVLSCLQW